MGWCWRRDAKAIAFPERVLSQCYLIFPEHGLISLCSSTLRKGWKFLIYCFEFPPKQSSVWNEEGSTFWPGGFLEFRKLCHFKSLVLGICFPSAWPHYAHPPEAEHSCVFKLGKTKFQLLVTGLKFVRTSSISFMAWIQVCTASCVSWSYEKECMWVMGSN